MLMGFDAWVSLAVTAATLYALARELGPTDAIFVAAVVVLALAGIITPQEAFGGFANSGVLMIGALFVVAAGLRETGVMDYVGQRLLGRVETEFAALVCLAVVAMVKSLFLNNTPIVALLLPVVIDWCRKHGVAPS